MNPVTSTLDEYFPFSPYNSARSIVRKKLESFQKHPSVSRAQELEAYGITVDYDLISTGENLTHEPKT